MNWATRLVPGCKNTARNGPEDGGAVTTTHVFRATQRRRAGSPLPISLRNPAVGLHEETPPRGGRVGYVDAEAVVHPSAHGILCPMDLLPRFAAAKKRRQERRRCRPRQLIPPREFASDN